MPRKKAVKKEVSGMPSHIKRVGVVSEDVLEKTIIMGNSSILECSSCGGQIGGCPACRDDGSYEEHEKKAERGSEVTNAGLDPEYYRSRTYSEGSPHTTTDLIRKECELINPRDAREIEQLMRRQDPYALLHIVRRLREYRYRVRDLESRLRTTSGNLAVAEGTITTLKEETPE